MLSLWQIIILGIVQSITEFLPISSSAHLVLFPYLLHWPDQGLSFDAAIHLGTLFAVLLYFRSSLLKMLRSVRNGDRVHRHLLLLILVATIPALLVGYFFGDVFEQRFRSLTIISFQLIFWGIILWIADIYSHHGFLRGAGKKQNQPKKTTRLVSLRLSQAMVIGLFQTFALMPGVSRSGITLTAALFQGVEKKAAAEFSFLLSIPIILAASLLKILELFQTGFVGLNPMHLGIGIFVSFIFGYLVIHFFLSFLSRHRLWPFALYRIFLGIALIIVFLIEI